MITIEKHVGNHHKDWCNGCGEGMPEAKMRFYGNLDGDHRVSFVLCRTCLIDLVQQGLASLLLQG